MRAIAFDTLKYADDLKKAGFPPDQAEGQAKAQRKVLNMIIHQNLATKEDTAHLGSRIDALETCVGRLELRVDALDQKLTLVEQRLDNKIDTLYIKLLLSLGGITVSCITILGIILKM